MNQTRHTAAARIAATLLIALGIYSCANMSRPGGGPRDETPPVFVKSNPAPGALNVSKQKIEIEFDEIIQIDKPSEKVVISPPQKDMPDIRNSGHKVYVTLKDSLKPETTYTIDFSDAIVDNNERNPLNGFSFSFSTGEVIDTLQISGMLLNARDLEPISGMMVGIHSNLEDSAFRTLPLERIASTDERGRFTIRNIAPGSYRVFALKDLNRDYMFDNPTEQIAFFDSIVVPTAETRLHVDTIWRDSITIDTVIEHNLTHFYPNDILLSAFDEEFKTQYLDKSDRKERRCIEIFFKAPADSLPKLTPLNFEAEEWAITERSLNNDSLKYWITDSLVYNQDTLLIAAEYLRTDSLKQLSVYNDTLKFILKQSHAKTPRKKEKEREKKEDIDSIAEPQIKFLQINTLSSSTLDIYKPLAFTFPEPIKEYDAGKIHLEQKKDTLWIPVPDSLFSFLQDSVLIRNYTLAHKWQPGESYRVLMDSTAFTGIYGEHTNTYKLEFRIKSLEDYANLFIAITGVTDSAYVEILDSSDRIVRTAPVVDGGAEFMYLNPGTYYARLFIDRNGNGVYDTGNYAERRQPEEVSYYPQELVMKANWDIEQDWDIYATPVDKQKPDAVKKNKPKQNRRNSR